MGMNCAEDPFNMGMFYKSKCHSKWVFRYQTHTSGHLYIGVAPPGSILTAEIRGLTHALNWIKVSGHRQFITFSDSKSCLQAVVQPQPTNLILFFYSGNFNTALISLSANNALVSRQDAVPHGTVPLRSSVETTIENGL